MKCEKCAIELYGNRIVILLTGNGKKEVCIACGEEVVR